ncbi:transcriptional regulator [Clostridia bacterium]|nr:transcriptional regulator [Clostridia bacterium]
MISCEKLDFLMNITKTSNSSLSMHVAVDSSHISRLRRGERRLVPNAEYVKKMVTYLVQQCTQDYQKNALLETMKKPKALFDDVEQASQQVYEWLLTDEVANSSPVAGFLNQMNAVQKDCHLNYFKNHPTAEMLETESTISLYYGSNGKREAVIRFLSIVLKRKKPGYLYLYSDETMDWLIEDTAFQLVWMKLLCQIISKGNRIRIIHTVSRNLDEMLEALSKWIPLYMTGAIEPFYYPKKRDGLFKRTMFIAPGEVALTASSFNGIVDNATNILLQDSRAILSLEEEFNGYLSLCKPLMRIFIAQERSKYLNTVDEFEKERENTVLKTERLSLLTMPEHIVESMLKRIEYNNKDELIDYFQERKERFLENIKSNTFNEIIKIDDIADIRNELVPVGYIGINEFSILKYRANEYRDHLKNIINLLTNYENYNVAIDWGVKNDNYRVYVKEDLGAIVEKVSEPYVVFALNEINITVAFWDYLNDHFYRDFLDKQKTILDLQGIVEQLDAFSV